MKQKQTKIIATIGPASISQVVLTQMVKAGMNTARLNFSHGTHAWHAKAIENIRAVSKRLNKPVLILQDLSGPKLRLGEFHTKELLVNHQVVFGGRGVPVSQPVWEWIKPGQVILIDDGLIELLITEVFDDGFMAKVTVPGVISSHKGLSLPGVAVKLPSLSNKDLADLQFGVKMKVDLIALSFVKTHTDILKLRKEITKITKRYIAIIPKIETPEALKNISKIINTSDMVMIARGDLALNIDQAQVPEAQKDIIKRCNAAKKPVIVATQMLDSMIHNPRPTRAEISDVANAVFDGADAVMLSGETAFGEYPVKTVQTMTDILIQAEKSLGKKKK